MPLTRLVESQATKTGTYVVTPTDSIVLANGTFTVYLYAASGDIGRVQTIRNIGSGTVTVQANGAETIDGTNTKTLAAGEAIRLTCDGTYWWSLSTSSLNANNATYLNGKTEGNLNVNNAVTANTANNTTYAFGKTEGALNANSANTANAATFLAGNTVTTNSTALYVGANVTLNTSSLMVGNSAANLEITQNTIKVNGSAGNANQVLTSNGSSMSWANAASGGSASTVYHCKVYKSANAANLTTAAVITFDSELSDTSNMHSTSSNTSQIVIPANGIYQVTGQLWLHQPADQGAYLTRAIIYVNGATTGAEAWQAHRVPASSVPHLTAWTGYLAGGSYVELYGQAAFASYPRGGNTYTTLEVTSLVLL